MVICAPGITRKKSIFSTFLKVKATSMGEQNEPDMSTAMPASPTVHIIVAIRCRSFITFIPLAPIVFMSYKFEICCFNVIWTIEKGETGYVPGTGT